MNEKVKKLINKLNQLFVHILYFLSMFSAGKLNMFFRNVFYWEAPIFFYFIGAINYYTTICLRV